jgi:hypothetical protein
MLRRLVRLKLTDRLRKKSKYTQNTWLNRAEKTLLRAMVLGAVLLTLFQFRTIVDPVDFYLKIAGDIDFPAFKYEEYVNPEQESSAVINKCFVLDFQAKPESPVLVRQNDKVLGIIGNGLSLEVEPGTVYLDATSVDYPVTVFIKFNGEVYQIELNKDEKSFQIFFAE